MKTKTRTYRPRIRSWEADPDVAKLLDLAVSTTGASLKGIVNDALRTHGPTIIQRLLDEREGPRRELEAILASHFQEASGKTKRPLSRPHDPKK